MNWKSDLKENSLHVVVVFILRQQKDDFFQSIKSPFQWRRSEQEIPSNASFNFSIFSLRIELLASKKIPSLCFEVPRRQPRSNHLHSGCRRPPLFLVFLPSQSSTIVAPSNDFVLFSGRPSPQLSTLLEFLTTKIK